MWSTLLFELLAIEPALLGDAESVINDIAHGEGGVQKIEKVSAAVAKLIVRLATASAGLAATSTLQAQASRPMPAGAAVLAAASALQAQASTPMPTDWADLDAQAAEAT